jgi:allantoinase
MKTSEGELLALPIMLELDDTVALANRRVTVDRYGEMLKEGFEIMYRDGGQNGRLLALNLYPWLIGQLFRIGYLDDALGHMMRWQGVWAATGAEIADWYRDNPSVA